MPSLAATSHSIAEAIQLIRNSHGQLAQVSRLMRAIELDAQQGQMLNFKALIQLAQQLCANISDDLGQQMEQLQFRLDVLNGEGVNGPNSVSVPLVEPSSHHVHIDWLVALNNALRSDVKHH